jgi:glycolate oxidase FAD binding subunit
MIGSFGTLAAISVVNFKLSPKPALERTCLLNFPNLDAALAARDKIVRSVLQPAAVDLLNPAATAGIGLKDRGYLLAVQFGGNTAVVTRYERELSALATGVAIEGEDQARFWEEVENYSPLFMERNPGGAVVRISSTMTQMRDVLASVLGAGPEVPTVARAASGVSYAYFPRTEAAVKWLGVARTRPWRCVVEFAPEAEKAKLDLWPVPGDDFAMMKKVKQMFDPGNLLNHGRLYRLI